ncbi:HD domain-containing protein [Brumimicrobium oceani]|uniref:Phosphohydrolase n=1 Tax=Brumimicrobium oceani TaxID=2100725 RepID=A0A2U2XE60_9FLAO|nr:HD domain-containing protein [Brumimicrobium oceani]PWH86092.1 phosphohydrolase [Brumimicrobium oceani]
MEKYIQSVEQKVKELFDNEATGHDWFHIDRVRKIALKIHEKEGGNKEIIELAALLHDISDHKFNGGDFEKGALISDQILSDLGVDDRTKKAVALIVKSVSFKGSGVKDVMNSLEGKIVQDADRIDAIGAIGIARTFAYGGAIQQAIYDPSISPKQKQSTESYVNDRTHTINHFYEKLLLLKDRMHTPTGKAIAKKRTRYMEDFLTQFYTEWEVDHLKI